ncbi:DMT family transporter [Thalassovita taeanensis]|uniref:EamA domain-containing membrane protein RarD n=1 Tax=Thalassovita taeanensis TaxID=657014 RepID=A0A1H9HT10_9RHOB|nr:DMT family transporter [Thalassovita taeanensis]SEQ65426.1 EamA domain-containing membrane protein RarD [Thalassovita taeanensis]
MNKLSDTALAIVLMIGAIFFFSAMDATAKELSGRIGPVPAIWARYAGQSLVVLILVAPRLGQVARTRYPWFQLARSILLMCGTGFFFFGIANIGLAEATAIMDINPVLITLGAALFLGEKIGLRRAIGIAAAMIGALIVIRPGSGVFSPYALLPLIAAFSFSAYNLVTRYLGKNEDTWTSMFYTSLFGTVILSAVVPFYWQPLNWTEVGLMAMLALFGTLSQLLLIRALSLGEAGMLAPYAYVGLIFATLWGIVFFDEFPDQWTILGALVIVISGIYVWHRETFGKATNVAPRST